MVSGKASVSNLIAPLDDTDRLKLANVLRKKLRIIGGLGAIIFGIIISQIEATLTQLVLLFAIWALFAAGTWVRWRRQVLKNQKLITRGIVTTRWTRDSDGGTSGVASNFTVVVNGIRISVPKEVYHQCHIRDVAEFHFFGDDTLLQHHIVENN